MKAKEMFEDLGYTEKPNHENQIRYCKEPYGLEIAIEFDLSNKMICKLDEYDTAYNITLEELKAINKQIEELEDVLDWGGE